MAFSTRSRHFDVIIIGSGQSGLVAASYCAHEGLSTLVLEAADQIGGLCRSQVVSEGLSAPIGATWFGMLRPGIRSELQLDLNEHALPYDAIVVRHNETTLVTETDPASDLVEAGSKELSDLIDTDDIDGLLGPHLQRLSGLTLREVVDLTYPNNPAAQIALAIPAVSINNSSLDRTGSALAPAFMGIAMTEGRVGKWGYVEGGMAAVTKAIAETLLDLGGEIHLAEKASRVVVDGRSPEIKVDTPAGSYSTEGALVLAIHPTVSCRLLGLPGATGILDRRSEGLAAMLTFVLSDLPAIRGVDAVGDDLRQIWLSPISFCPDLDFLNDALLEPPQTDGISQSPVITMSAIPSSSIEPPFVIACFTQYVGSSVSKAAVIDRCLTTAERCAPRFRQCVLSAHCMTAHDLSFVASLPGGHPEHLDMGDAFAAGLDFRSRFTPVELFSSVHSRIIQAGASTFPGGMVTGATGRRAARAAVRLIRAQETS